MKRLKYLFLAIAIVACCGSCDKDDDDPNLKIIYENRMNTSVSVSIYSLLDLSNPIMHAESDYTPHTFSFTLNPGDYRLPTATGVNLNFQIRNGRLTTIRFGGEYNNPEVIYK